MSNHFSAENFGFPGDDRRLDLTDLYVFPSPQDPGKTTLIITSNPTCAPPPIPAPTTGPEFYPGAVYRINVDTDGDALADIAFAFTFSEYENGSQTGTARYATGADARQTEPVGMLLTETIPVSFGSATQPVMVAEPGEIRLFAGLRSDPFFSDAEGALHGLKWTGHDDFADNNVDAIVLEVPSDLLGPGPVIGVWATVSRRSNGVLEQLDRGGHPTLNAFINPSAEQNPYNSRQPADDVANYLGPWSQVLEKAGYPPEEARRAALQCLPDILRYDRTKPVSYPNGRKLIDDVYSYRFAWLTYGKVPPTGLHPHNDLTWQFPYLGPPDPELPPAV
ncbi:DUF4331 family protein [Catellatospora paridis]|uniref:DUF4331 family protein n=1 Tax=Catellatospora paridis TaxID=1617086 RepID=UPI0012D459C5|nr:DUF4331 family protein [Catellatospora paridis]